MLYRFALRSEAETFPFFQDMTYVLPERPFGAVGGAFDFELNGEFITYATTDDDGNVQSDQYFVERSAAFAEAIRAGDNSVTLRLAASRSLANGIWLDGLAKKVASNLGADDGFTVDQLSVRNRYARISRVEAGTGSEEEGQCNEHGMNDYAEGIGFQFLPNNPIEGGARSVFYHWGQNILLICSDTPVGVYPLILQIIDGRGGKIQTELVIEVLEERVAGGKVEWFPSKPGAEGDSDGDGVARYSDAFPNDPAASVDTDGDGKPDDWNDGKSQIDSTSDPALVIDEDDDEDGVLDLEDAYPYDGQRSILDGYQSSLCGSNYCVLSKAEPIAGQTQYFYRLREEETEYDFHYGEGDLSFDSVDGSTSVAFEFFDGNVYRTFQASGGLDSLTEERFLQALASGEGRLKLRASAETSGSGWLFIMLSSSLSELPIVLVVSNEGAILKTVDQLTQAKRQVVLKPPLAEGGEQQCFSTNLADAFDLSSSELDRYYFSPSRSISQGRHGLRERIFTLSAGRSDITVCTDSPAGSFEVAYEVMDGVGGKKDLPLSVEILKDKIQGGAAEWLDPDSDDDACKNGYCLARPENSRFDPGEDLVYYFKLTEQPSYFPFEHADFVLDDRASGGGQYSFQISTNEGVEEVIVSGSLTAEQKTLIQSAIRGGDYHQFAAATGSEGFLEFKGQNSSAKTIVFGFWEDLGGRIENLRQLSRAVRVNRPVSGTGIRVDGEPGDDCSSYSAESFARGLSHNFFMNIEESSGESNLSNHPFPPPLNFTFCEFDTKGTFDTKVNITDGRGGKVSFPLTIIVDEERVAGGSAEWFASKDLALGTSTAGGDRSDKDGDGVPDAEDAFPDDAAASLDTDGDGKPDEWNAGQTAADSTSDPVLVIDDDDDGDGVADEADFYPRDASRSIAEFSDGLDLISDAGLRNCIQNQFSSLAGTDSVLAVTQLNCARAGISSLAGLELFAGIEELELRSNPIQDLRPVASLNKLKVLMLGENGAFVGLPVEDFSVLGALVGLESLEIGWVASNGGVFLGDASWISNLTGLRTLMLRGMGLSSLEFLQQLPSLLNLSVSYSEQLDLSPLVYTPNLLGLGVDGIGLKFLDEIPPLSSLTDLDVRANNLTDLVGIDRFQNLRTLYADENRISDLQALSGAPQLQTLGLIRNDVSSIAPALLDWGTPLSLTLTDNPVSCSSLNQLSQNQNVDVLFESDCVQSEDSDDDGVSDDNDAFPDDPAASVDTDGDGKPDDWNEGKSAADSTSDPALVLDDDDDNDGVLDSNDAYPLDAARTIFDLDDDRVADGADNCPAIVNADQSDIDDDLLGDVCDDDIDGDSCPNAEDAYPTDPKRCELGVQKAIIVAGGGPYSANFLWEATERMAELSIKTLKAQGIEEDHIYYLSAGFGDVYTPDGPATAASVRAAIVDWTQEGNPADDVLIYLVDHGGFEVFELAQKEQLGASDLDGWLDELQASLPGQLTVVYDACQSGSFIPVLRPDDGQDRLVLTSSGADERAHFAARGDVSFSFHFWSNFLIGGDIYRSFVAGSGAMNAIFNRKQNAEIEVDGDGVANAKRDKELARAFSFGQGVALASDVPFIGRVSEPIFLEGQGSVAIEAFDVVGSSKVVRVWALVDTPDDIILPVDEPLTNIGLVELINPNGDGNWTGLFEGAATKGVYEFKVFAQNQDGLYSSPPVDGSNTIIVVQKSGRAPQVGRDSDQDGILDQFDPFPSDPRYGLDGDADLIPDVVDPDRDGDDVRDDYQGKDIFEVALEPELMGYVVQDADEVFATFHDADDVDRFIVIGLKGEQLTLNVRAQADAVDGPDFTLAIVDAAGAVLRVGNEKLFVDDALQAQAETLTFTVPETGRYIAQIGQAQLQTDPGYVTGARSEYALLLRSDRKRLSDVDVAAELTGLRYRAEGLAWRQPLAVTEASRFGFNGQLHLLVPEGVAVIGYPEGQCELSGPLLSCRAETADSLAAQLVAESSGVRELALYAVQNDEAAQRSKEPIAADNLKVLRFVVSEDQDLDGLPDDYERMRGTDPRLDDAFADIDRDGTTNLDEYLSGFDPFSLNTDADSDGRRDDLDAFPRDAAEWSDFDGDGIGDNADADDDGDGH